MFQFLGILFLIGAAAIFFIKMFTKTEDEFEEGVYNGRPARQKVSSKSPDWMISLNKKLWIPLTIIGILVFMIPYLLFFAERGYSYLLVHPSGKLGAVMEQGIKWRGLAKIDPW